MNRYTATAGLLRRTATVVLALPFVAAACGGESGRTITLGVPTTVEDSGLLDSLLVAFAADHPEFRARYISAGSGELLALGALGDVDVLIAHSPQAEHEYMQSGHGLIRREAMENHFVIVGPLDDPAGVAGMGDAAAALARIAGAGARFVSRGDDSGTHRKETVLWEAAGVTDRGGGYRELGGGMGSTLRVASVRVASELQAYTLSDIATYLFLAETLDLQVLVEGDSRLLNVYSVIVSARAREVEGGRAFADWMTTSEGGKQAIAAYGVRQFSRPLFRPRSTN